MLGGRYSLSGKLLIEDWILKVAGFNDGPEVNSIEKEEDLDIGDSIILVSLFSWLHSPFLFLFSITII